MPKLTIRTKDGLQSVETARGALLSDVLRQAVPAFSLPCAGRQTCGKCRVLAEGALTPPDKQEAGLLRGDVQNGVRLACACRITGDASVTLLNAPQTNILSWSRPVAQTGGLDGCGIVADIGTTTVVVQLYARKSGKLLAQQAEENAQRGYGADVVSRIEACAGAGLARLSDLIREQLERMAQSCLACAGLPRADEAVVTGNTAMLHIFEGIDPAPLAVAPFNLPESFGRRSRWTLAGAPVYLPRCVEAFIGADTVCAVLAVGLSSGGVELMADIGTNGEIALAANGRLYCCSAAAGPAFEGAGLHAGMPAVPGAVCSVARTQEGFAYQTISGRPAAGLCGSGIIDALAVMLETQAMDETGLVETPFEITRGVTIDQHDVRQIQLAKAAVCAGVLTLLRHAGLDAAAVERFWIAGGFGAALNTAAAAQIGLFPAALQDKADFIGNGALGGAVMLLLDPDLRARADAVARQAVPLSLSASEAFASAYIDCMYFRPY